MKSNKVEVVNTSEALKRAAKAYYTTWKQVNDIDEQIKALTQQKGALNLQAAGQELNQARNTAGGTINLIDLVDEGKVIAWHGGAGPYVEAPSLKA